MFSGSEFADSLDAAKNATHSVITWPFGPLSEKQRHRNSKNKDYVHQEGCVWRREAADSTLQPQTQSPLLNEITNGTTPVLDICFVSIHSLPQCLLTCGEGLVQEHISFIHGSLKDQVAGVRLYLPQASSK